MILTTLTIIVEFFLMLGLILCVAYCSGYITLASTNLVKGNPIVSQISEEKLFSLHFRYHCITFSYIKYCYIDFILYGNTSSIR